MRGREMPSGLAGGRRDEGARWVSESQESKDRAARVAAMRDRQQRKERRRAVLVIGSALAVVVVLVGAVVTVIVREQGRQADIEAAANAPIDGVEEFPEPTREHVEQPVSYERTSPVGGGHVGVWTNCGVYTEPTTEQSVHSLEHGAGRITYQPDLPAAQVEALTQLAGANDYALLSPFEGQETPVVASAWAPSSPSMRPRTPDLRCSWRSTFRVPRRRSRVRPAPAVSGRPDERRRGHPTPSHRGRPGDPGHRGRGSVGPAGRVPARERRRVHPSGRFHRRRLLPGHAGAPQPGRRDVGPGARPALRTTRCAPRPWTSCGEFAAQQASDPDVRRLAQTIVDSQNAELTVLFEMLAARGGAVADP